MAGSRRFAGIATTAAVLAASALTSPVASAGTKPVAVTVGATNGSGRAVTPGRACEPGGGGAGGEAGHEGTGAYWHFEYTDDLPNGFLGTLPGEVAVHLDLHSDLVRYPNISGPYAAGGQPSAFLLGTESHLSLLDERGSVKLRLSSGDCDNPTLNFDGSTASGSGTWTLDSGTGAYRDATSSGGTFVIDGAQVDPGADNALALRITSGTISIPSPNLGVTVVRTYWGGLGLDYVSRRVSVVYRITNTGDGDAFGATITALTNPTNGVEPRVTTPIHLGDLAAGESVDVVVRHQLALLAPCALVILNCSFQTRFVASMPDAFGNATPAPPAVTVVAKAPNLPPPL